MVTSPSIIEKTKISTGEGLRKTKISTGDGFEKTKISTGDVGGGGGGYNR